MLWPDGPSGQLRLRGRARDAVTLQSSDPVIVETAATEIGIGANRRIDSIAVMPHRAAIEHLIGCRGGGHLRAAVDEHLPGERQRGHPLYLLLDDISGTSLIAGFALMRWPELHQSWRSHRSGSDQHSLRASMEGVCIGFAPGASSLDEQASGLAIHRVRQVEDLGNAADPHSWHDLPDFPQIGARRARRIDVWREDDVIRIDSSFQDSASDPELGRIAVHEYLLRATVDAASMRLLTIEPDPRILPFLECPSAIANASWLVGSPVAELRTTVLERLSKTNGCTHLNDALRALAEVPVLLNHLDTVLRAESLSAT
jgi:Protein of unknown function (DUF2889)